MLSAQVEAISLAGQLTDVSPLDSGRDAEEQALHLQCNLPTKAAEH